MSGWNALVALHAAGATFAVVLGGVVLLTPRKGDVVHRRLGRIWMLAMYWTAGSSFGIKKLHPGHFSWIHGLSAWTIVSLTIAWWAARTSRRDTHRGFVVGSYCGLLGAGVAAMAFPQRLAPRLLVHQPAVFLAVLAAISLLAWAVVRLVRALPRGPLLGRKASGVGQAAVDPRLQGGVVVQHAGVDV